MIVILLGIGLFISVVRILSAIFDSYVNKGCGSYLGIKKSIWEKSQVFLSAYTMLFETKKQSEFLKTYKEISNQTIEIL